MDELLSCPFCGANAFDLSTGQVKDPLAFYDGAVRGVAYGYVSCLCGATVKAYSVTDAIKLWNTRSDAEEE